MSCRGMPGSRASCSGRRPAITWSTLVSESVKPARDAHTSTPEAEAAAAQAKLLAEASLADLVRAQLVALGEDPARSGLLKTPERVEASLRFLTRRSEERRVGKGGRSWW